MLPNWRLRRRISGIAKWAGVAPASGNSEGRIEGAIAIK
jgi:hypothetical protein